MERHWKEIRLKPDDFPDHLISKIGFKSFELLGTGDHDAKGFRRNIYVFKK